MSWGDSVPSHHHDSYEVYGVAQEYHSHSDLDGRLDALRSDITNLYDQIAYLSNQISELMERKDG